MVSHTTTATQPEPDTQREQRLAIAAEMLLVNREARERSERATVSVIRSALVHGMSMRRVSELVGIDRPTIARMLARNPEAT